MLLHLMQKGNQEQLLSLTAELFTLANGLVIKEMGMVSKTGKMVPSMKANMNKE